MSTNKIFPLIILMLSAGHANAEGDAAKGERVFKKCAACHSIEEGKNKVGPSVFGIVGREAGTVEGFKYSDALLASGIVWDDEQLGGFLASPRKFLKGTKMSFSGLRKDQDIADVLAYLKTLQ